MGELGTLAGGVSWEVLEATPEDSRMLSRNLGSTDTRSFSLSSGVPSGKLCGQEVILSREISCNAINSETQKLEFNELVAIMIHYQSAAGVT